MKNAVLKIALCLTAFALPLAPAAAETAFSSHTTVAFALESDRNTIEYRHMTSDVEAAHDHAMLETAKFLLSQGKTSFKVERVTAHAANWTDTEASQVFLNCGQFVCSERMKASEVADLRTQPGAGEIIVRVHFVSGADAKTVQTAAFNTGQIMNRVERAPLRQLYASIAP